MPEQVQSPSRRQPGRAQVAMLSSLHQAVFIPFSGFHVCELAVEDLLTVLVLGDIKTETSTMSLLHSSFRHFFTYMEEQLATPESGWLASAQHKQLNRPAILYHFARLPDQYEVFDFYLWRQSSSPKTRGEQLTTNICIAVNAPLLDVLRNLHELRDRVEANWACPSLHAGGLLMAMRYLNRLLAKWDDTAGKDEFSTVKGAAKGEARRHRALLYLWTVKSLEAVGRLLCPEEFWDWFDTINEVTNVTDWTAQLSFDTVETYAKRMKPARLDAAIASPEKLSLHIQPVEGVVKVQAIIPNRTATGNSVVANGASPRHGEPKDFPNLRL